MDKSTGYNINEMLQMWEDQRWKKEKEMRWKSTEKKYHII